tara:strand:+ start:1665 stop:2855 length:1191 start_codon:yes stop_codon:yes gene_type:complete
MPFLGTTPGTKEADFSINTMTGDNSDTTLSLSKTPANENFVQVYYDGVYQHKDTFSVSGNTVTFSTAPATGVKVEAIVMSEVVASSVTTINDDAVTTAKILNANVTTAKIADDAITSAKIADDAITSALIADDAITSALIADDAITTALIADDAVAAAQIADNSVDIARLNVSDGSNGQFLRTNGSGTLSFATVSSEKAYNDWAIKTTAYTASNRDQLIANGGSSVAKTYAVTVAGGVFYLDGVAQPVITLTRGVTYTFTQSDGTNNGHPIAFKDSGGSSYTTGVTSSGTPGNAGANTVLVLAANAPVAGLRYYCTVHGNGMGNTINVVDDDFTITLPAGSAGNTVIIKATGGGTTVTIGRNGSQKINSVAADATLFSGNGVQLVYVDDTVGWLEI